MPDKKPTDKEIIKALEEWRKELIADYQRLQLLDAPMDCFEESHADTVTKLSNALDLINRLQAEKQDLEVELEAMRGAANSYKAENKRLYKTINGMATDVAKIGEGLLQVKAEAYKEFLPLLENFRNEVVDKFIIMCDGNDYNKLNLMSMVDTIDCIYDKHCDNLLKELVGEDNE